MSLNWSEEEEKALIEAVDWVSDQFPGADGKEILQKLGGKWEVISQVMKRDYAVDVTGSSCKTRFYRIKSREVHTKNQDGKEVIIFNSTEFPQADVDTSFAEPTGWTLQSQINALKKEVQVLKERDEERERIIEIVEQLNDSFQGFFKNYK